MTRAFVIEGTMRRGDTLTNVVGIAFLPDTLKTLTGNMLENMGFRPARRDKSLRFEAVTADPLAQPLAALYFYDRSVTNRTVSLALLNADCTQGAITSIALDTRKAPHPRYVMPPITGSAAVRVGLADAANAPNGSDFRFARNGGAAPRRAVYAR